MISGRKNGRGAAGGHTGEQHRYAGGHIVQPDEPAGEEDHPRQQHQRSTSARMVPIINMVRAELQFPMLRMVSVRKAGRGAWVNMSRVPRYTDTRQGWVMAFLMVSFRLVEPVLVK